MTTDMKNKRTYHGDNNSDEKTNGTDGSNGGEKKQKPIMVSRLFQGVAVVLGIITAVLEMKM